MSTPTKPVVILMADDDADDRLLAKDALTECKLANDGEKFQPGRIYIGPADYHLLVKKDRLLVSP